MDTSDTRAPALAFIEAALGALERSVRDREGELRNVQLATVGPDGRPDLRTVVLRGFDRATAEIHSDARAGKTRDIAHASPVALLAWSAADRLQLRFAGTASLHRDDAVARARWDKLPPKAREPYGLRADPGSPIVDPADQPHLPPDERRDQFTVVLVALEAVDVLRLEPGGGQTRAEGRFTPAGVAAHWIGA